MQHLNRHLNDVFTSEKGNPYSVQTFVFKSHAKFIIRANVWVKPRDYGNGTDWESRAFLYGAPHNHNFDFLTVGYLGNGYWTDIYELQDEIEGYEGEIANLKFLEHTSLPEGKVMFFRKFKDVHDQLPPADDISVSLNLMVTDLNAFKKEQYEFDLKNKRVVGAINRAALAQRTMFSLASLIGNGDSFDVCIEIAKQHINSRTRLLAWEAVADLSGDALSIWRKASNDNSAVVKIEANRRLEVLN